MTLIDREPDTRPRREPIDPLAHGVRLDDLTARVNHLDAVVQAIINFSIPGIQSTIASITPTQPDTGAVSDEDK